MVPTCSGEYKQQLVAFLDRFKADSSAADAGGKAAARGDASASVGLNVGSLAEEEPENETAEDSGVPETAAAGRL